MRAAPRRFRLPSLPADVAAARAAGPEVALAFAIEALRLATRDGGAVAVAVRDLFTEALAEAIVRALHAQSGDASFQALVLRQTDAAVAKYVRLASSSREDRRLVRSRVEAIAHPGKLQALGLAQAEHGALQALHGLARAGPWPALREHAAALAARYPVLATLATEPALDRLEQGDALLREPGVQHYLRLCERAGPSAGSAAAAAQGRAAARTGNAAEAATVAAFERIVQHLDAGQAGRFQVVRSLRTPRGFPGDGGQGKEEWDAAIVRSDYAQGGELVLLAEVKAAPAAAAPDWSRLVRGLQRLAQAQPGEVYVFPCADGEVRLAGDSLRRLQARPEGPPPVQVIYCCALDTEPQAAMLAAASKAVLLAEPASVAFAQGWRKGAVPGSDALLPVWQALPTAPRLRSALNQHATARLVREAMLHPQDLLEAFEACRSREAGDDVSRRA